MLLDSYVAANVPEYGQSEVAKRVHAAVDQALRNRSRQPANGRRLQGQQDLPFDDATLPGDQLRITFPEG